MFMGKKGQASIEAILIVAILLGLAVYLMNFYSSQTKDTAALAIIRQDVDCQIQKLRFDGCNLVLDNITQTGNVYHVRIKKLSGTDTCGVDTYIIQHDVSTVIGKSVSVDVQTE